MHVASLLLLLPSLVAARPQDSQADALPDPVRSWQAHYAAVERELLADVPAGLTLDARRARAGMVAALRAFRERGEFTRHENGAGLEPRFVDAAGRRCAVAELLHVSGEDARSTRLRA